MAKKKVELLFPEEKAESIARETVIFSAVQAFMMVDQTKDLLEEGLDMEYAEDMIVSMVSLMEDLATLLSVQNVITSDEFDVAAEMLEKAYAIAAEAIEGEEADKPV